MYRKKHADKTNAFFFGSEDWKWCGSKLSCMVSPLPLMALDLLVEGKGLKPNEDRQSYYPHLLKRVL